jgi:hypothetical protein
VRTGRRGLVLEPDGINDGGETRILPAWYALRTVRRALLSSLSERAETCADECAINIKLRVGSRHHARVYLQLRVQDRASFIAMILD